MDAAERKRLEKALLLLRAKIGGNVSYLGDQALVSDDALMSSDVQAGAGGGSHIADVGTDANDRDRMLGLLETGERELVEIEEALDRLRKGTYGECEHCRKSIPKARLRALPFARLCVRCQEQLEVEGGAP